jgi:hypothetical protein
MLALVWACGDDETAANTSSASTTGGPTSSSSVGSGGNGGDGGTGSGATGGSVGGSGGSIVETPCSGDTCDLSFEGSGFTMAEGMTLHWALEVQGQMGHVHQDSAVVANGAFAFSEPGLLEKGTSYNLKYFVDSNENGLCDLNMDPVWRIQLPAINAHLQVSVGWDIDDLSNLGCFTP